MVIGFVTCLCVLMFAVKSHNKINCTHKIFQMFTVIRNDNFFYHRLKNLYENVQ